MKQFLLSAIAFGFIGSVVMQLVLSVQTGGIRVAGKHIDSKNLNSMGITTLSSGQELEKAQNKLIWEGVAEDYGLTASNSDIKKLAENFKLSKKKIMKLGIPVSAPSYMARNKILVDQLFGVTKYLQYNQEDMHTFTNLVLAKRSGYYIELNSEGDWINMSKDIGNFTNPSEFCEAKGFTKVINASFRDLFTSSCNNCCKSAQCYKCLIRKSTLNDSFNLGTPVAEKIDRIAAIMFVKTKPNIFVKYVSNDGKCYVVFVNQINPPTQKEINKFSEHANKLLVEAVKKTAQTSVITVKVIQDRQDESNL